MSQSIKVLSWRDTLRDAVDVEERKEYEAVAARRPGTEGGRPGAYAEVSGAVATRMAVAAPSIFLRPEDDAPIDPQHELLLFPSSAIASARGRAGLSSLERRLVC
mmetsp:Transcript_44113/g.134338  ORF Transcript_44113/g.134338 Transcript_44113/m.134338 type:complete len:105 (-) Transcript_44113:32-346(-)